MQLSWETSLTSPKSTTIAVATALKVQNHTLVLSRTETAFNSRSAVPLGLKEIYDMERRGSAETAERSRLAGQEALASQCPFSKPLLDRDSTEDIREND